MDSDAEPLSLAAEFPAATREQWLKLVEGVLKGADFDKRLVARTYDGTALQPIELRRKNAAAVGRRAGAAPWVIAQRIDLPSPAQANAQALDDLMNGANGLTLVFRDSISAHGFGLPDATEATLAAVMDRIEPDMGVTFNLDIGRASKDAGRILGAIAGKQGITADRLDILFGLDAISQLAAGSGAIDEWGATAPQLAGTVEGLLGAGFRGPFLVAEGRLIHAAGGSDAQELGAMLSSAITYLRALTDKGLPLATARSALYFRLAVDADQIQSIAKIRALRQLWARVETACGLEPAPALVLADTAWRMLTRTDPQVNILRNTVAVFAAAVGGADLVTVLPYTAAIGLADVNARRLARNTQSVLLEEANLARVYDPAAGSGAIEAATAALAEASWDQFQKLEGEGGIVRSLIRMTLQSDVAAVRAARLKAVASRRDPLTGSSEFPDVFEAPVTVLEQASRGPAPRENALTPFRLSEPFEKLRNAAEAFRMRTGQRPKVFLANLGTVADFSARSIFAKNFFEAGGIETIGNDGFTSMIALVAAFRRSGARIACLCSSDKLYEQDAMRAADALRSAGGFVWMAGRPGAKEAEITASGVETFIHAGGDVVATLQACQRRLGV